MSDLYREATEAEASDYHSNQLATIVGVPVEPVGEAIVWGHRPWELVITDPPYQQLPPGEYLIVPKEADDEERPSKEGT